MAVFASLSSYFLIGALISTILLLCNKNARELPAYKDAVLTEVTPFNLDFARFQWSGRTGKLDINHLKASLRFPGPPVNKKTCIPANIGASKNALCFWVETRSLLLSDPYYPRDIQVCKPFSYCDVHAKIYHVTKDQFLPSRGIASIRIPAYLNPNCGKNTSPKSANISYSGSDDGHLWVRSFNWKYEGTYMLMSRRFERFNFTYIFPAILPSGKPNVIFGKCGNDEIKNNTCSTNIMQS